MRPAEMIERKRNGEEHDPADLEELVLGYARDEVPDYQMAAWCMAVYFNGPHGCRDVRADGRDDPLGRHARSRRARSAARSSTSTRPAAWATRRRSRSGPIVAACGVPLGKMSGRGLGHTGGTLDKLESIPGFRVELSTDEMIAQLREVGVAIVGQTDRPRPGRQEALRAARRDRDRGHSCR